MSALSRSLVLGVLVTLVVWLLTLDWAGGQSEPITLSAPLPGLFAGLIAAVATLALPAGERLTKRTSKKSAQRMHPLVVPGAVGGLVALGAIGGQLGAGQFAGIVTGLARQMPAPAAVGGKAATGPAQPAAAGGGATPVAKSGGGEVPEQGGPPAGGSGKAAGPGGKADAQPAPAATATATAVAVAAEDSRAAPSPTADPTRYELTAFKYDTYPEAGAGSLTLTFRDRRLDRPVLAYYDMVRDTTQLTLTMSATAADSIARSPNDGLVRSIDQRTTNNGRLQLLVRLAKPGIAIVDETSSGKDGIQLMLVPDAGFGSLSHAPTTGPSATPTRTPVAATATPAAPVPTPR